MTGEDAVRRRSPGSPQPGAAPADPEPVGTPLPRSFFARSAAVVARELLGKVLVTRVDGMLTGGRIVEAEAYLGSDDPGSHAATRGITERNRVMYGPPGRTYVYFTYGNHHMLNIVTGAEGEAGGVLIRAVEPLFGAEVMAARRGGRSQQTPARGPGCVTQAFEVNLSLNDRELGGIIELWDAPPIGDECVDVTGRVGLRKGHELPLRFYVRGSAHVSNGRMGPPADASGSSPGKERA